MPGEDIDSQAQATVVMEVLQRPDGVSVATVVSTSPDLNEKRITAAAESLDQVGVIRRDGDRLYASPALERLDAIAMVAI
jgi:hypothetical protein